MEPGTIAKLIGKVFIQKSAVNLLSSVLDTPEFFWREVCAATLGICLMVLKIANICNGGQFSNCLYKTILYSVLLQPVWVFCQCRCSCPFTGRHIARLVRENL